MTSSLNCTTEVKGDHYLITASVQPGGALPQEIFLFENTGANTLGTFQGTCSAEELSRLQVFKGTPIPTFGNRFVRASPAKIKVSLEDDPVAVTTALLKNVILLSTVLKAKTVVFNTYIIP